MADTRRVVSATELYLAAALACNTAWVKMSFLSVGLYAAVPNAEHLLDSVYLISIICVTITFLICAAFSNRVDRLLNRRIVRYAIPICLSFTNLLMSLSTTTGALGEVMVVLSGILSGVFSGLFLIYFGQAFALLPLRSVVVASAISTVLSMLLFCVFLLFAPLEACLFVASMPLVAVFLLNISRPQLEQNIDRDSTTGDSMRNVGELRRLVIVLTLCSCFVGFANELARTVFIQVGIIGVVDGYSYSLLQGISAALITIVAILIAATLFNAQTIHMPNYCYRLSIALLIIGVLGLPVPLIYPEVGTFAPYAVNSAAYQCYSMMIWILTAGACRQFISQTTRTFAFVRAGWAAGPLLGMLAGRFIVFDLGANLQTVFGAMLLCVLGIVFSSFIIFTETDLTRAMNIIPWERRKRFQDKCRLVIERHGLSEREGEVMTLFAKGYNLAFIQEKLNLSRSTISTHRQHIYQKLTIHSAQELLDVVQNIDQE